MPRRIERDVVKNIIRIIPADGMHSCSILLMHGLGDTGDGMEPLAELMSAHLPYAKIILPTASSIPITINMGANMPGWYDITGPSDNTASGIDHSSRLIQELIEEEFAIGIPYSRISLAGFSQGGALSLYTGLQLPAEKKLGGLVVMSGYLAGASNFRLTEGLEEVKVFHCHGLADTMGVKDYTLTPYPNLSHSINEQEIQDIVKFLTVAIPYDATAAIPAKSPAEMSIKELKAAIREANLGQKALGLNEKSEFVKLLEDFRAGKL